MDSMSRALDLFLLLLVGLFAWLLVRSDDRLTHGNERVDPITAKVRIAGTESLEGLGLLLIPGDDLQSAGGLGSQGGEGEQDTTPHQLAPFYRDRTTQIIVPVEGRYRVRFGLQDQGPPPRRPRGVMLELPPEAKTKEQVIEVTRASDIRDAGAEAIVIELPAAHAAGLHGLRESK